jgi:formate/nitrite transporter FocA (FNT family)
MESIGVAKARLATLPLLMPEVLAVAFIALGALLFVLVEQDLPAWNAFSRGVLCNVLVGLTYYVIYGRTPRA